MPRRSYDPPAEFPATHWTLVARAAGDGAETQRQALEQLLRQYLPALRSHLVYRKRIEPDRAEDLLQAFLCSKVLEQGIIGRAQQEKGRFRNFLMVAIDRFVVSEYRKESAAKRRPNGLASLDADPDMARFAPAADAGFDLDWARQLLAQAIAKMEHACTSTGRADVWGVFQARVLGPATGQTEEVPYEALVERYGLTSPAQASNVLMTAKRTFVRTLRAVVSEYEKDPADVDAEIADLIAILSNQPSASRAREP